MKKIIDGAVGFLLWVAAVLAIVAMTVGGTLLVLWLVG